MPASGDLKVTVTRDKGVAVLSMDNPPVNALSAELVGDLGDAITELREQPVTILIVRSALEASFCAGAELKETGGAATEDFVAYVTGIRDIFAEISELGFPTIAAVDGAALGGGLELALSCDFIFAGRRARLGLPEVKLGILPGAGGTQRLPRRIGGARAKELMLSGRQVGGEEAERLGLAFFCPDGAFGAAASWAEGYLENSSMAGNAILGCVEAASAPDPETGFSTEISEIGRLYEDGDAKERISSFMASRSGRG